MLADGARLVAAGLGLGLDGAVAMTRAIASVLPYARGLDRAAFGGAIAVIAAVGLAAYYLPARAAARVDPLHRAARVVTRQIPKANSQIPGR